MVIALLPDNTVSTSLRLVNKHLNGLCTPDTVTVKVSSGHVCFDTLNRAVLQGPRKAGDPHPLVGTSVQRCGLVGAVARSGDLPLLQQLWGKWGWPEWGGGRMRREVWRGAAGQADQRVLQWLRERVGAPPPGALMAAVHQQSVPVLGWLVQAGCPWPDPTALSQAVGRTGDLAVLQWLTAQGAPHCEPTNVFWGALVAEQGGLEVMQAMWDTMPAVHCLVLGSMAGAIELGVSPAKLVLLREHGLGWSDKGREYAVLAAKLRPTPQQHLQWLHDAGCPLTSETFWDVAGQGNLEVMQWLFNAGCSVQGGGVLDRSVPGVERWLRAHQISFQRRQQRHPARMTTGGSAPSR